MNLSSGDISSVVFKRIIKDDLGDFSLDSQMLTVFMELDGATALGPIAQKIGLNMSTMRAVVSNLLQLGIIIEVKEKVGTLDNEFLKFLVAQLSLAVGPIAGVLIEDEINALGCFPSQFPCQRVGELIERLSREIRREAKKNVFKANMLKLMREKGYTES
jgi:hypothetical protein